MQQSDEIAINEIVDRFFDLFTNSHDRKPDLHLINELFIAEGILINNTTELPAIYNLESFVQPRKEILTNGTLTDFEEREVSYQLNIFGNIAQRNCTYEKSGCLNGVPFTGRGKKLMQLVKVAGTWKLTSVLWADEA